MQRELSDILHKAVKEQFKGKRSLPSQVLPVSTMLRPMGRWSATDQCFQPNGVARVRATMSDVLPPESASARETGGFGKLICTSSSGGLACLWLGGPLLKYGLLLAGAGGSSGGSSASGSSQSRSGSSGGGGCGGRLMLLED